MYLCSVKTRKMYKTRNLPNTRIDVADALRGIAVAGIILYHSVEHFNIFSGRLTQLLCLFILGMQLGRQRMFYNEGRHLKIWHSLLVTSGLGVITMTNPDFGELDSWLHPIYNLIILLMIVSAVVSAWYAFEGVRRVLRRDGWMRYGDCPVSLCPLLV